MKFLFRLLTHLLINFSLIATSPLYAEADPAMDGKKAKCLENSANEWSYAYNRCVVKVKNKEMRKKAEICNEKATVAEREDCHMQIAETETGLSADKGSLNQGKHDKGWIDNSLILNGAYTIVALINSKGGSGTMLSSSCTSKKIFGYTAVAGILSDLYLKDQAKKKIDDLSGRLKLDADSGASSSQSKALEFLKEEQNTVADIASQEKNRNMLLMLGYGAASFMAMYEMTTTGHNPDCAPKKDAKKEDGSAKPTETTPTETTPTETTPAETTPAETTPNVPGENAGDANNRSTQTS